MDPELLGDLCERHPGSRSRATRTTSSRRSCGHGSGMIAILPGPPPRARQIRCLYRCSSPRLRFRASVERCVGSELGRSVSTALTCAFVLLR